MPLPNYGAPALVKTFVAARTLTVSCMAAVIGLCAHFVAGHNNETPSVPAEVMAVLAISCLVMFYLLMSMIFFWTPRTFATLMIIGIIEAACLVGYIVMVAFGQKVDTIKCSGVGNRTNTDNATSGIIFMQSLASDSGAATDGTNTTLMEFMRDNTTDCYQVQAIWGLCVTITIGLAAAALLTPALWVKAFRDGRIDV